MEGFNEAIVSLYAKGLTTGEIQAHLAEIYQVDVSRDLISRVTDTVADELASWQSRPLDRAWSLSVVANPDVKGFACRGMRGTRCRRRLSAGSSS